MAQIREVAALRRRLKSHKYYNVKIERYGPDSWMVQAVEPMAGIGVQRLMSLEEIVQCLRW